MSTNKIKQKAVNKQPVTIIKARKGWVPINLRDIWTYRELIYFFIWRDIKVRYKQTAFGFLWAIIQPLLMMIVFSLFFGKLAGVPSNGIPYPLFSYSALLPWTLFSEGLTRSSNSLASEANLIQKVYFPRIILPLSSILSPLVDFFFAFLVLFGLMFYYGYIPTARMFMLPALLILQLMLTLGGGFWLSAINVEYRDIRYAIPFFIQLLMFASPIIYSSSFVPERYQAAYGLINPLSGIIEAYRWAILGTTPPNIQQLLASAVIILVILISGAFFFRRREAVFADYI
jgi:lipopolysaccharide transport system permease protein